MDVQILKDDIENWLNNYFENKGTYNRIIYDSMSYSLNIGGKRIRPLIFLLTYAMYKNDYTRVLPIACSIEMIHTYSLIHDDLPCMDNDDLRRGYPTNHKKFNEAIAVLAGDGLLNEAMNIMFKYCITNGNEAMQACYLISNSSGVEGMIGGQVVDIISEGKEIALDELEYMHKKKTGKLIMAAIISGAMLGNAKTQDIELLYEYGEKLGLAFQIKDDILDIVGETDVLGKPAFSDMENNKTNFITTYGLDECIKMCIKLTEECISILKKIHRDTTNLEKITTYLLERKF